MPCSTSVKIFSSKTAPSLVMKSLPIPEGFTFKSRPQKVLIRDIRLAEVKMVISSLIAGRLTLQNTITLPNKFTKYETPS